MVEKKYLDYMPIIKALADETRVAIIELLKDGELCACKLLENFKITQPTLSYHMKSLTDCGLVKAIRDGAWIRYSLNKECFLDFKDFLKEFCDNIKEVWREDCDC